jgi:hypothetical protein
MAAAISARASPLRCRIAVAAPSPAAAALATSGASRAKPAGPKSLCTTSALMVAAAPGAPGSTPRARQSWGRRGESGRRPSAMARLALRPSRPISMAEPAPSSSQPQPAQRCSAPWRLRPTAMVPVPLISTRPSPSLLPIAPSRAVRSSPVTTTRPWPSCRASQASCCPWLWTGLPTSMPLAPTAAARSTAGAASPLRAACRLCCRARRKASAPPALAR